MHLSTAPRASKGSGGDSMPDTLKPKTANDPKPQTPQMDNSKKKDEEAHKRIEHIADKAAHKASKTEQEYDRQNTEISK
jgi:hypothetical protein